MADKADKTEQRLRVTARVMRLNLIGMVMMITVLTGMVGIVKPGHQALISDRNDRNIVKPGHLF